MGTLAAIGALVGSGGASAPVTPVGGLLSLTITDDTPIDPVSSVGATGSGWVAICVLKGITSTVGTVVPSDLTLTVSDPGYDTSGNATTVTRTITGVAHLRRQYPNGASKMVSTDGTDLTLYVTLDDWIYSGTTIVSASIGSTFYPSCTAGNAGTKTNSSTIAYPKPSWGWVSVQRERATSDDFYVEGVTFSRHATAGQQVACVKYTASDGTTDSPTVTASTTALSTLQTQGNIAEVWPGTLDVSGLTQGAACTVNAEVFPWIGDSSAVLDLSVDGDTLASTRPYTLLNFTNDRTGAYGGAYAYVQVGAVGGTVSATPATAKASPYPTITSAITAIQAWNNTNKGHNDLGGGTIRLMDTAGADTTHTYAASLAEIAATPTWCFIEKDPESSAVISIDSTGGVRQQPNMLAYRNVRIAATAGNAYTIAGRNQANNMIYLEGCTIDNTQNKDNITYVAQKYLRNCTLTGTNKVRLHGLPPAGGAFCLWVGLVTTDDRAYPEYTSGAQPRVMIGCNMPGALPRSDTSGVVTAPDSGRIAYNNKTNTHQLSNASAVTLLAPISLVQNMIEVTGALCFNNYADSDLTTVPEMLDMYNTSVGERSSRFYNDNVSTKTAPNGVIKRGKSMYSVCDNYNLKDDRFTSGVGSVGAWAYSYGVGNVGNVSLFGTVSRGTGDAPHNDNLDTPYMGSAWLPSSEYNLYRTALGFTQAQIMDMFTNYTTAPRAVPALGGNYQPLSTAAHLRNRVDEDKGALKYDIAGNLRKTDGTGAAGAYEAAP